MGEVVTVEKAAEAEAALPRAARWVEGGERPPRALCGDDGVFGRGRVDRVLLIRLTEEETR